MKKTLLVLFSLSLLANACASSETDSVNSSLSQNIPSHSAGTVFTTNIESEGTGEIAIQVQLPQDARYESGAPVFVYIPTSFTPDRTGFAELPGTSEIGFVQITLMFPGRNDKEGLSSEGEDDYGGAGSLQAIKDTLLFANDQVEDVDGLTLSELSALKINTENVGVYAFSHPGIAAMDTFANYGQELTFVDYFVGRENPTEDVLSCMEVGYSDAKEPVFNPLYSYPDSYDSEGLRMDYTTAWFDQNTQNPYLDLNTNRVLDASDYALGSKVPTLFGKRAYSEALIQALLENGALSLENWPSDLITPEEAREWWPERESLGRYEQISKWMPELKVMLVFSKNDHVQILNDKPHIHQAYDGFNGNDMWVRLNPDSSYLEAFNATYSEHPANTEPQDWVEAVKWGMDNAYGAVFGPLAAVLEMADRTESKEWSSDLDATLYPVEQATL